MMSMLNSMKAYISVETSIYLRLNKIVFQRKIGYILFLKIDCDCKCIRKSNHVS